MGEPNENNYQFHYADKSLVSESDSNVMYFLMEAKPHKSSDYTWDEIGMTAIMMDAYPNQICYCPQNQDWYVWDMRWVKQPDNGLIMDRLQTVLNLLLEYCKEQTYLIGQDEELTDDEKEAEKESIEAYKKFLHSMRKNAPIKNIVNLLSTNVRQYLTSFDSNPYLLNTTAGGYNLKDGKEIADVAEFNPTMQTNTYPPYFLTNTCERWYDFIDEIMSYNEEKAKFLQRALGYSLLGVNREECMFVAYGSQSRNGKGTLFRAIEVALGSDYFKSTSPKLICEKKNGETIDYNSPQPMLATLMGSRIVSMSEAQQSARLDAAAMKSMTGRDTLTTRGLYEKPFSFVPQFTMWLNTNYLPVINDNTVFASDRVWVITFDEKFDGEGRDKDLKEYFTQPENLPTVLGWLLDGCKAYMKEGLNPPECVIEATANYRRQNDRIGRFIDECCEKDPTATIVRGDLYQAYRNWCCTGDNRFKPIGSTTFYQELSVRGIHAIKNTGVWYLHGLKVRESDEKRIKLV